MIRSLTRQNLWVEGVVIPQDAVWIDLISPTRDEELAAEEFLNVDIPTPEELHGIEASSRLYEEGNAFFMTTNIPVDEGFFRIHLIPTTFVLAKQAFVTLRYEEVRLLDTYMQKLPKQPAGIEPARLFFNVLQIVIDSVADLVEQAISDVEHVSISIFPRGDTRHILSSSEILKLLLRIGVCGEGVSLLRESLGGLHRLSGFLFKVAERPEFSIYTNELKVCEKDISTLVDSSSFISNRIAFLLNATLGLVNLQQNDIIKIFSVVSVILLPPTLFASLWGMNFRYMPELSSPFGYPIALVIIVLSSLLPYLYCKKRRWL
jgi:magnesium transporter